MFNEGTAKASRAAIIAFAMVFFLCVFTGFTVAGACSRGAMIGLGVFMLVKIVYHLFMHALVDELSTYWKQKKGKN